MVDHYTLDGDVGGGGGPDRCVGRHSVRLDTLLAGNCDYHGARVHRHQYSVCGGGGGGCRVKQNGG